MAGGLAVDQRWRRMGAGRTVEAGEEDRRLTAVPWGRRVVGRPGGRVLGARLRRVVDDVDVLMRRIELVGRRSLLRVAAEERVARLTVVGEVAAVARDALVGGFLAFAEYRVVRPRLRLDRLRGATRPWRPSG